MFTQIKLLLTLAAALFAPLQVLAATPVIVNTFTLPTTLTQGNSASVILLGKDFGQSGTVLVNGKAVKTDYYGTFLSMSLAEFSIDSVPASVVVQVQVKKGNESIPVEIKVVPSAPATPTLVTPTITWATPASIPYGAVLTGVQLNATASVPGTFVYKPAFATALAAGTQTLTATFTPTDTTKYTTATASVSLTVSKAIPTLSWAAPASITTATALSATQLNATSSVAGTFVYSPAAGATLSQGTQTLTATFTPTDATDYASGTASAQIVVTAAPTAPTSPTTPVTTESKQIWYIRADGGGRYSASRVAANQGDKFAGCDGLADAAYPGSGTNQHCAFNDFRLLYDAQTDYGVTKWVISGGDDVIVDDTKQWRIGSDYGAGTSNWPVFGWGAPNGIYGMVNPAIPAGTSEQHTRILGRNYGSCNVGNNPDKTKMTQLFGGYGVWNTLNLSGTQYVDVECLEITSHSACTVHGSPAMPKACATSTFPLDDYDGSGISTDTGTANIYLQDLWIHGHTDRGIKGALGGLVTTMRVDVDTNGMAGWDLDPGDGTTSPNGAITMHYSTIEWSGCNQVYPDTRPTWCYSQGSGGYGDGIGTPPGPMGSVLIDHSTFRYNTQDGEDFGHVYDSPQLSITNSKSYGNNGGQFKWAGFRNVTFQNNLVLANCARMHSAITGIPSTFNQYLADYCRAGDALSFDFNNNSTGNVDNNTIVTYAPTTFDVQCYDSVNCANTTLNVYNNIIRGYDDPFMWNLGGQQGGGGSWCFADCNGSKNPIGVINRGYNIYYGLRGSCPATGTESCMDPDFTNEPLSFADETTLDQFNYGLIQGSPAGSSGKTIDGLSTDYLGNAYTDPFYGALAPGSAYTLPLF